MVSTASSRGHVAARPISWEGIPFMAEGQHLQSDTSTSGGFQCKEYPAVKRMAQGGLHKPSISKLSPKFQCPLTEYGWRGSPNAQRCCILYTSANSLAERDPPFLSIICGTCKQDDAFSDGFAECICLERRGSNPGHHKVEPHPGGGRRRVCRKYENSGAGGILDTERF